MNTLLRNLLKGIHSKSATFMMPREPRKRGKGKHDKKKRGISKQQICIGTVIDRNGNIIMVDDDRMKLNPGETIEHGKIRFRTLGCYPLTGGIESNADTLDAIIQETLSSISSERTSRIIDKDSGTASMEKRKREGYF